MYSNLKAEMRRYNVTQRQIALLLNCREATVSDKLNGKSELSYDDAMRIKKTFFPMFEAEYLFFKFDDVI